jgi:SAM-dependent methyltransferase
MSRRLPYPGLTYKLRTVERYLALEPHHVVAEIGIGTGYACFRMARKARRVLGVDVAAPLLESLEPYRRRFPNLEFLCAHVGVERPPERWRGRVDRLFSVDTVQYVEPVEGFFRFARDLLAPTGRAVIAFHNELPEKIGGRNHFADRDELEAAFRGAGMELEDLLAADYTGWFRFVHRHFWSRPKRWFYGKHLDRSGDDPQVFSDTVAFDLIRKERAVGWPVRVYTAVVMEILRLRPVYRFHRDGSIRDRFVLAVARKRGGEE